MVTKENSNFGPFGPISYKTTKKIIEQMQKNICIIQLNIDKEHKNGTGFFCKIHDSNKENLSKVLITTKDIINETFLKEKNKKIIIFTKEKNFKTLDLKNRNIYVYQDILSFIEIKEKDDIQEFFDLEIINTNGQKNKQNNIKNIYMLEIKNGDIFLYFGLLKYEEINKNNYFYHTCPADAGSSGSPILNFENNNIIGIHMPDNLNKNRVIFFNFLDEIQQIQKSDVKTPNEVSCEFTSKKSSVIDNNNYELTNGFDLSYKKGFKNFNLPESSKLNSIIQMLTSIKEIYDFINKDIGGDNKEDKINKFSHIYILTSFLSKAHKEIYQGEKSKNPSLKEMNTIIKFLSQDIKIESTYDYILFILNELHEELISYKDNFPRSEKLISFESPFNNLEISKNIFFNYYEQQYSKSIISDLFNWIIIKNKTCNQCKNTTYSFQALPLISFNLDSIIATKNKEGNRINELDLPTCFNYYFSSNCINIEPKDKCINCNNNSGFSLSYTLKQSPKYFIIVVNRAKDINLAYSEELEIPLEKQCLKKKYKLISIIIKDCKSPNNYSYVVKNREEEKDRKIIEEWKSFKDENIRILTFDKIKFELVEDVYDPLNVKILVYKDITGN